jgi:hypothetical protein
MMAQGFLVLKARKYLQTGYSRLVADGGSIGSSKGCIYTRNTLFLLCPLSKINNDIMPLVVLFVALVIAIRLDDQNQDE